MTQIDNTGIWLDAAQRPREYAGLDWVNARSLLHPFAELSSPQPGDTVVDIGTGTGAVALHIASMAEVDVTGVDISEPMLRQIPHGAGVWPVRADARDMLPFDNGSVDVVTTRMMLHDIPDPSGPIKEAWRIVRPGGRLVAAEYVIDLCAPKAIDLTDAFEEGRRPSSLVSDEHFTDAPERVRGLHQLVFALKHEPDRHLWQADQFERVIVEAIGHEAGNVRLKRSLTPFNSVANWLGKSGYDLETVKQEGIITFLAVPDEVKSIMGMHVTIDGKAVPLEQQRELLDKYVAASVKAREDMAVDVKIHRVFANVVAEKRA